MTDLGNVAETLDSLRQCDLWLLNRMNCLGEAVADEMSRWRVAEAVHSRAEARIQSLATEVAELRERLDGVEARTVETERRSANALSDARSAIGVLEDMRRLRELVREHTRQLGMLSHVPTVTTGPSAQVRATDDMILESLRMSLALQFEQVAFHLRGQRTADDVASRIRTAQREALHRSRGASLAGEAHPASVAQSVGSSRAHSEAAWSPRSGTSHLIPANCMAFTAAGL